jgi:riboflavin synthase
VFTGIIESLGKIIAIEQERSNFNFAIQSSISHELKVDQSLSHSGVCLTVTKVEGNVHYVTAIDETMKKTNLGELAVGNFINLERCMIANGRFDGHVVQGHVDQTAICTSVEDVNGSWLYLFEYDPHYGNVTVEKGSIAVNGVSLTCFNSSDNGFSVAIIPYTYEHTSFNQLKAGDTVNLEFDIIGKYVKRLLNL